MKVAVRCQKLVSVPFEGFKVSGMRQSLSLERGSKACWYKCTITLHLNWATGAAGWFPSCRFLTVANTRGAQPGQNGGVLKADAK